MVTIGREVAEPFDQPFALDHHFAGHASIRWITSPNIVSSMDKLLPSTNSTFVLLK
jgi:hypothetical protein